MPYREKAIAQIDPGELEVLFKEKKDLENKVKSMEKKIKKKSFNLFELFQKADSFLKKLNQTILGSACLCLMTIIIGLSIMICIFCAIDYMVAGGKPYCREEFYPLNGHSASCQKNHKMEEVRSPNRNLEGFKCSCPSQEDNVAK